jgi:ribose transport system permease protein
VLVVALVWVVVRYSAYGRAIKAIGSNVTAAELAGLTVQRSTVYGFMFMGACAGLGAVIIVSRASQQFPDSGSGLLLAPYAAAFLGAAVSGRGRFGPWSTLFGALFIGTLTTGLTILNSPAWLTVFIQGLVLLVAVLVTRRES